MLSPRGGTRAQDTRVNVMRLLALMVLLASCSAHGDDPDNYCNDAEINQQWTRLLMKSPDALAAAVLDFAG